MSLSLYRTNNGFFSKIHPTTRIIMLLASFVPPFFNEDPLLQTFYLLLIVALAKGTGSLINFWRMKGIILAIFLVSLIVWSLTLPGDATLIQIGTISLKRDAVFIGLARGLRLLSFLASGIVFITVTSIEEFTYGLHRLGLPYRMCFALTLAFRLTPLFMESASTIAIAQRTRGLDLDSGGPIKRIRHYLPIFVPVLVSGFRRADSLAIALHAKGFELPQKRSFLIDISFGWRDALLLCIMVALIFSYQNLNKFFLG